MELNCLVSSSTLRSSERLVRFLRYVVEQKLAGNGDQLKESVLAVEIFDRETTYDSRVNAIVRVEARRLREKLAQHYAGAGRDSKIVISLPKGSYAPVFTLAAGATPPSPRLGNSPAGQSWTPRMAMGAIAIAALFGILVTVPLTRWLGSRGNSATPSLRRLTSDSGLTFQPALSPDGKLVAYSSDRGGDGSLDIWLQQVSGGLPLRLTDNPADDVEPAFSPDGTAIAYRAEGEDAGVYLVPALGGKRVRLAAGGYRPRFSPKGNLVAYWTGERTFRTAEIFLVPAGGGKPVQFRPEFSYAAYPIWSPDGEHIAFVGSKGPGLREETNSDDWDWWVAPLADGPAVPLAARKTFEEHALGPPEAEWAHLRIVPGFWAASGHLVFSARSGDRTNIWRLPISSKGWRVSGPPERLTFDAGRENHPSPAADGAFVFSVLTRKSDVWALPLKADTAESPGALVRLTSGDADYLWPMISRDGNRLTFVSNRTGSCDVWVKDIREGRTTAVTASREEKSAPILSPDGSKVAFSASRFSEPLPDSIFVVPAAGGPITPLCSDCGEPRAWFPDGTSLLYQKLLPHGDFLVGSLDLAGRATTLLRSSESALFSSSISSDGKWLALVVRTPPNDHRIVVVPLRDRSPAARSEWVSVSEPGVWVDKPRWSSSGHLLYYISDQDGFICIWVSRLDPATKRPLGPPKAVAHFHTSNHSIENIYRLEFSVAVDKLVFNLGETSGNVWLAPAAK